MKQWLPPTVIIAMVVYVLGAVWWSASLSADVKQNKLESSSRSSHSLRIGILEERWRRIDDLLVDIRKEVKALRAR